MLHSERFADAAPAQVWATLLDESVYLASEATFYRLLRQVHGNLRERRAQATHPAKVKPELVARPEPGLVTDIERHEALSNRVEVGDLHRRGVAAAG